MTRGRTVTRRRAAAVVVVAAVAALTGCAADEPAGARLVVLAAASLTDVLPPIAEQFERTHPGTQVVLSFGGSAGLAQSVAAGAPADVLAVASPAALQVVLDSGDSVGEPVVFARNSLEIAVPTGNPGAVTGLADFARDDLDLAVCAAQVPCGAAAASAFTVARVDPRPDTLEQDVRAVLTKVRTGEVDAGLVYATDVRAAGDDVEGVTLPPAQRVPADYPAVALSGGASPDLAADLVAALLGADAQRELAAAGFLPPL
ncbi:MAG: modA [Frankiales bacterium]|nr:modA [Frankiales bacterium]